MENNLTMKQYNNTTMYFRLLRNRGFSSIEVMLAAALLSFFVVVFVGAFIYGQDSTAPAGKRNRAVNLAEEGLEASRNIRDASFSNLTIGTHGLALVGGKWQFSGNNDILGIFSRNLVVADIDANTKQVTCNINWMQNAQRNGLLSLVTYFTNWRTTIIPPLTCDWANIAVPTGGTYNYPGNQNGAKVQAKNGYAYAIIDANGNPNYDFVIHNVSNPANPTVVGTLKIASGSSSTLTNIVVLGNYAYVSSANDNTELTIINVTNPAAPTVIGTYNAPGSSDAKGLYVVGTNVYLVRDGGNSTDEFLIIDVTNPASPALLGSTSIGGNNEGGNEVYVSGTHAYISSPDQTRNLKIVDISNPNSPTYLTGSGYKASQSSNKDALTIMGFNNTIILGSSDGYVYLINITDPANVNQTSEISRYNIGDVVNDLAVGDYMGTRNAVLFVVSASNVNKELNLINIANLSSPTSLSSYQFGLRMLGVSFDGNQCAIYMVGAPNSSKPEFYSVTIPDTAAPSAITDLTASGATTNSINLTWTAPGDDGNVGLATSYDIRYSTSTINDGNWASATQVTGEPTPLISDTSQSMTISGLNSNTTYYFAMKASDEVPNTSTISNITNLATLATQADTLSVNIAGRYLTNSNKDVAGITINNTGTANIIIDKMTISWTGGAGSNTATIIRINGGNVWTGSATSGQLIDITNFTLVSGHGSYPINYLRFSKSMNGGNLTIIFTMADGTTKTVSGITF